MSQHGAILGDRGGRLWAGEFDAAPKVLPTGLKPNGNKVICIVDGILPRWLWAPDPAAYIRRAVRRLHRGPSGGVNLFADARLGAAALQLSAPERGQLCYCSGVF